MTTSNLISDFAARDFAFTANEISPCNKLIGSMQFYSSGYSRADRRQDSCARDRQSVTQADNRA